MNLALIPCDQDGVPVQPVSEMPEALAANCLATAELYRRIGFVPSWIGYVAVVRGRGVGGGAFVGPPKDGFVRAVRKPLSSVSTDSNCSDVGKLPQHRRQTFLRSGTLIQAKGSIYPVPTRQRFAA